MDTENTNVQEEIGWENQIKSDWDQSHVSWEKKISADIRKLLDNPDKYKDYLLRMMIDNKASDMYLTNNEPPCLRIYDKVYRINQLPDFDGEMLNQIAYMFMEDIEWEQFRENLDLDLWWSYGWRRYRINISRQQKSIMIVFRLLSEKIPTIAEMWLPSIFSDLVKTKSGIILLAWPTGSWKSTTLAAMIQEINLTYQKHIITIEDPIEYVFTPEKSIIEQKQLWSDVVSYTRALRAALRQKPDVILFWEMRDLESIEKAVTLAETGHLVLSTIHSKSSSQTINKIIDSFPADQQNQIRIQLSETLVSVVSQRLLRKKDWSWMVAAHEIMLNNTAISNLIRENQIKQINNVIQTSRWQWMQLLEEHLIELVEKWYIELDNALATSNNPSYITSEVKNRWIIV